jgi:hypothetical protein
MFDVIPVVFHRLGARKNLLLGPTIPSFGAAAMGIAPTSQGRGRLNVSFMIEFFSPSTPRGIAGLLPHRSCRYLGHHVASYSLPGHGHRYRLHHFGLGQGRLSMDGRAGFTQRATEFVAPQTSSGTFEL